jgi:hypothetical protein
LVAVRRGFNGLERGDRVTTGGAGVLHGAGTARTDKFNEMSVQKGKSPSLDGS